MTRERDAIEEVWGILSLWRSELLDADESCNRIEQILTMAEEMVQEDLEKMSKEKACPLFEAMNLATQATNTKKFWDEEPRDSGIYSPI